MSRWRVVSACFPAYGRYHDICVNIGRACCALLRTISQHELSRAVYRARKHGAARAQRCAMAGGASRLLAHVAFPRGVSWRISAQGRCVTSSRDKQAALHCAALFPRCNIKRLSKWHNNGRGGVSKSIRQRHQYVIKCGARAAASDAVA